MHYAKNHQPYLTWISVNTTMVLSAPLAAINYHHMQLFSWACSCLGAKVAKQLLYMDSIHAMVSNLV